uniref:Uncharacterized protein n=1 Tax=Ascaris lumbricoides TaxID=6252 RepID=A0A9J2Q3A0_ASCLU
MPQGLQCSVDFPYIQDNDADVFFTNIVAMRIWAINLTLISTLTRMDHQKLINLSMKNSATKKAIPLHFILQLAFHFSIPFHFISIPLYPFFKVLF